MNSKKFGKDTNLYTIKNSGGMEVDITDIGAATVAIRVKGANGETFDVVRGFANGEDYKNTKSSYGATVGRYANRIRNGQYSIDGTQIQLECNEGNNHIHGGFSGLEKRIWKLNHQTENCVELSYISPDGEDNYPGNLDITVRFSVTEENEYVIDYSAIPDRKMIFNITNHSFFDLTGKAGSINDTLLKIYSDYITPIDKELITTGELMPVKNTPFDFNEFKPIGNDINAESEQIKFAGGFDHNFVIRKNEKEFSICAEAMNPDTKIKMSVYTDLPGVQFYAGNFMDGSETDKNGIPLNYRTGFCLETQYFPNSPNIPKFPDCTISPEKPYKSKTIYRFEKTE